LLKQTFPEQLNEISLDHFLRSINKVEPSLIRTEADELTYHFHIMIRYELEKALISGNIKTADIPACWNEYFKSMLDLKVPDDVRGCLQDVHWSHGSFGYFATYSLGSLYAAQFYHSMLSQLPDADEKISKGDVSPLMNWLKENIFDHGRFFTSSEICRRATGKELDSSYFIDYVSVKMSQINRH
jgi:carboxypeptidase Taq